MARAHSYILLKDKGEGHPCGQLVQLGWDNNYITHSHSNRESSTEIVSASSDEVAALTEEECRILDAINSDSDRYTVYSTPGKLTWGLGLKVGDTVMAKLPPRGWRDSQDYTTAVIRCCDGVGKWEKYLFGIEITVS